MFWDNKNKKPVLLQIPLKDVFNPEKGDMMGCIFHRILMLDFD